MENNIKFPNKKVNSFIDLLLKIFKKKENPNNYSKQYNSVFEMVEDIVKDKKFKKHLKMYFLKKK